MGTLTTRELVPGSRQASVFGVGGAFVAFISAVIAARVYVRVVMLHALGTDDVLMVLGSILAFGLTAASMTAAYYGVGRHVDDIPKETMVPMLKSIYSTRIIYVLSLGFVKVSLLIFYLRLDHRRYMKWIVYALQFVVVGLTIASVFILAFSCYPPAKFWDLTGEAEGHCMDPDSQQVFYEANGILNIITDICIYLAPIPMLWGVRISNRRKGALFGVFGLGILSIAAGCVRYDFVKKLAHNPDQYYSLADSLNWCSIEIYVAVFCGSAPALSVLVKTYAPALLGSSGRTGHSHGHPSGPGGTYRLSSRPTNRRRLSDTIDLNGSQDNIIAGQGRSEGIMMKTDIHMEVNDADSTQTHQDHFRFGK
ncbi:hypothetical protein ASPSYDRAFT_62178 [Aspergillus sydowii CBS 593.65]|uniref:Rhodopsin domain-containing protein n=1 Tax=Aspergillus sydowii CBS 593.65 TaxID=1036612 RepID=A0A1L9T2F2_9EURO|nr:uncharacterized protein ASPSYDRAFT_62178 [Aspergillus sydowii CBS 593.65]OJJ53598.1 hypothetical protein ASPSYDRAFT_62178 [Aspergillus sydowii CBS 593.65]